MADRYAYLPLIGFFIMICWGVADWASQPGISAVWLEAASLVVLAVLTLSARRQISYWQNDVTLWSHTVQVTGPNYLAEDRLGKAFVDRAQLAEALVHFQASAAIAATFPSTHLYIGYTEQQRGNLRAAIEQYQKVIALTEDVIEDNTQTRDDAFMNMGYAYQTLGEPENAQKCFAAAESQRQQYLPHR
jgi:tetratricopeptide (TPR) repeat protein